MSALFCVASCAGRPAQRPVASGDPPARHVVVRERWIALRVSPYVELLALLDAQDEGEDDDAPEIEAARDAFRRAAPTEAALARASLALGGCADDRCAGQAVEEEPYGAAYARALPVFLAGRWRARVPVAWAAIEASHAALSGEADAALTVAARALGVTRGPEIAPPVVDVTGGRPPRAGASPVPRALAARGACFARPSSEKKRGHGADDARVADCLGVHAFAADPGASTLHAAIVHELGGETGATAWAVLVVHVVAAAVTAWSPRHESAYRAALAAGEERAVLEWLAREWRGAAALRPGDGFAGRYAAAWREAHAVSSPR